MSIDANQLQAKLLDLLCRTARENGRVEITNCGGGTCMLISKAELESLESALEILSRSRDVRWACDNLARLARVEPDMTAPGVTC